MKFKKLLAVLLTTAISLPFIPAISAASGDVFTASDALIVLKASTGEITLTDAQKERYGLTGDITAADALVVLRKSLEFVPIEPPIGVLPPHFHLLSPEENLALRESYAEFKEFMLYDIPITAEDLTIMRYYGKFNGYDVVVIFPENFPMTMDMQYIDIAGHQIALGSGRLELMVHKDGVFTEIREAFSLGFLTEDDIKIIAEMSFDY